MFSYYGSKSKIVDYYPPPKYKRIIEPFAGSARYSLKYFDRDILLIEKYQPLVKLWKWLQIATEKDIDNLPILKRGEKLSNFNLSEGERLFLSFCVSEATTTGRNMVTERASTKVAYKIKKTKDILPKIKHWEIKHGCYTELQNEEATWFIDPPYQRGGEHYRHSNKDINYIDLSEWCKKRLGQTIVCENDGAEWLPFIPLKEYWGGMKRSIEVIWSNEKTNYNNIQQSLF
jgi:site-specific DNA-adenine methylase